MHCKREPHGTVNRLNTARIPLCLPPQVKTPFLYTLGLSRYAEIYLGLEAVWLAEIGDPIRWIGNISGDSDPEDYSNSKERIQAALRLVYLPELMRTKRFETDFLILRSLDPQLAGLDRGDKNAGSEFRRYIEKHIPAKPHLLVAYIWIMYQALFNGGLFIRMQLLKAGPEFWGLPTRTMNPAVFPAPLSFWQVDGEETVKSDFRSRIIKADKLLTEPERKEILQEAVGIFHRCELITLQLDEDVHVKVKLEQ